MESGITFSTNAIPAKSKTKVLLVKGDQRKLPDHLTLYGKPLPFVPRLDHLGHILTCDGKHKAEVNQKKACFLRKMMETKEKFSFAHPRELLKAIKVFTGDFYGSNTWELGGKYAKQVYNCWRTVVKDCWGGRWSHSHLHC